MNYTLEAKPGKFTLVGRKNLADPKQRILDCEKEIAAVLEEHNCILIISVAAKE